MSLTPVSTFLTALGSRVALRSFVQLKLTTNCHLCHFRLSRNFGSSSALLCRRDEGWQQWHSTIPTAQELFQSENVSPGQSQRAGALIIRDSDTSLVKQISLIQGAAEILEFIETVEPYLFDDRVLDVTSKCLFSYLKAETSAAVKKNILQSFGMQKLCRIFNKQSSPIEPSTLVSMLKVFSILDAPASHPTFQSVVRRLSKQASSLRVSQMIYLEFLLEKMNPVSKSALTEALTLAIPMLFESQLKSQVDSTNVFELSESLTYIVKHGMPGSAVQIVIDAIMKNRLAVKESEAFNILWLLGQCKQNIPDPGGFIDFLFNIITTNVHTFSSKRIANLVRKSTRKYMERGDSYWYNKDFVESACHRLVECGDDESTLTCFKSLTLLNYVNVDVIEAVVKYVLKDPTILLNNDELYFSIVRGLSGAAYKPEKWNILEPMLVAHPALTKDLGLHGIILVLDFLALDVLVPNLVSQVFSPYNVHNLIGWYKRNGPFFLLLTLSAIRHLYPEYNGPLPPRELVRQWEHHAMKEKMRVPRSLERSLQSALGGPAYVLTGVFEDGLCLEHCVVMDQNGLPVAIQNTKPHSLKHIEKPSNSSLILIQVYAPESYAANTSRLRGVFTIQSKIWSSYSYPLIEVELTKWKQLPDADKIPWLMQKIGEKTNRALPNSY